MKNLLFLLLATHLSLAHSSPNWVRIADSEMFLDKNSIKRNGDLTMVVIRDVSANSYGAILEFDCKKKTVINGSQEKQVEGESLGGEVLKIICPQKWQIWK